MADGVAAALTAAAARLAAVSDTPRLDAEYLMAYALGVERMALLLSPGDHAMPESFAALVDRRMAHEPVAYIAGVQDFWTIRLRVGPGVLIPRGDSEVLIEAAIAHFGTAGPRRILDLGTGPGTLLLAALAEWPEASGLGVDASAVALDYARANAQALGLAARVAFVAGDWAAGIEGRFDLILCNPPYIESDTVLMRDVAEYEPQGALFAGTDGLDDYRRILPALPTLLERGGIAVLEIGYRQRAAVTLLAQDQGFAVQCHPDLAGRDRALVLQQAVTNATK